MRISELFRKIRYDNYHLKSEVQNLAKKNMPGGICGLSEFSHSSFCPMCSNLSEEIAIVMDMEIS